MKKVIALLVCVMVASITAGASANIVKTFTSNPNVAIPDSNGFGVSDTISVPSDGNDVIKSVTNEQVTFEELVAEMVREDLKAAERDELVKRHGFKAFDYHE